MRIFLICVVILSLSLKVAANTPFYKDNERGWFWFEDPELIEKEKEQQPPPPQPGTQSSEMVELSVEWLRENFQVIMDRAMNSPTDTNLANFAYAQRLLADIGSRFSSRMTDYMQTESMLDESRRRPFSSMALTEFHNDRNSAVHAGMSEIGQSVKGVWFFYSSSCSYCHRMVPVIKHFSRRYNVEVLAISLDGGVIPGLEDFEHVYDEMGQVARQFDVRITPTLHLVGLDDNIVLLAEGMMTVPELVDKTLIAARRAGYLSDDLYAQTRYVREDNVFNNETGGLMADRERLESDPDYLSGMLRERLANQVPMGTPVQRR